MVFDPLLRNRFYSQTRLYFHTDKVIEPKLITSFNTELTDYNYTVFLKKSTHNHLSWPYSNCINYDMTNENIFQAMSYIECYRKCLINKYIKRFNCTPIFIDNFITLYDITSDNIRRCSTNLADMRMMKNEEILFVEHCLKFCPKTCFNIDYSAQYFFEENYNNEAEYDENTGIMTEYNRYKRSIFWDSSEPMFTYTDEPVLTFTQYLVFCGGLMGLWFGQSLKDLFTSMFDWKRTYNLILLKLFQ